MAVNSTEVRSGVFVILAMAALSILVFSVGNFRSKLQKTVEYSAYLENVRFIKPHDPIAYGGFQVGEVKSVEVSDRPGQVKIVVQVPADLPVLIDSALIVRQDGILGPKFIEVSPGTPGKKAATPGAVLAGLSPATITDLSAAFEGPLKQLEEALSNINKILSRPDFQQNVTGMLEEARKLLVSLTEEVKKVADAAAQTAGKSQEVLGEIQDAVKSTRAPLAASLKNAEELTAKLSRTADEIDRTVRDADGLIVQNSRNIYETVRAMRDTAYHLEQASKRIRANPSIMLFGAEETPEERKRIDETDLRLKGRARRYDKETSK